MTLRRLQLDNLAMLLALAFLKEAARLYSNPPEWVRFDEEVRETYLLRSAENVWKHRGG